MQIQPGRQFLNAVSVSKPQTVARPLAIRFGMADELAKSDPLAKYPTLKQHVFKGETPDETPLTQRKRSTVELYKQYRHMIRRTDFREHYRGAIPFIGTIAKIHGIFSMVNPFGFKRFVKDVEGVQEWSLQEYANETAFEHGVKQPMALLKQGKLDQALDSFRAAFDAAPARHAEIYETLAEFCSTVARYQKQVAQNKEIFTRELEPHLEFRALNSSLGNNLIRQEKGKESNLPYSYSSSSVYGAHFPYPQPIDSDNLRQALKETPVPFRKLAEEAFRKAADLMTDDEQDSVGHSFHRPNPHKRFTLARAEAMGGDFQKALAGFKAFFDSQDSYRINHESYFKPYIQALQDGGRTDEAVETMAKLINDVWTADHDEVNYVEFLQLCEEKAHKDNAQNTGSVSTQWSVALPYLKAGVEEADEHKLERGMGGQNRYKYLALAYEGLGQKDKAIENFEQVLKLLEHWPKGMYPDIDGRESKVSAEVNDHIDKLSK